MKLIFLSIAVAIGLTVAAGIASDDKSAAARENPFGLTRVAGISPFASGCGGQQAGVNFRNAPVEPFVAGDPRNPGHLVGVWQQDRWSNGGSNGLLSGVSMDGGTKWTTASPRFSICQGGAWDRASDPWAAISPDGSAYFTALVLDSADTRTGVLVSRSADGGASWSDPVTLIQHSDGGDDKESITADPNDAHYVYDIWDRLVNNSSSIPTWFSRTSDGGATWDPARIIYDPGANATATAHQIAVLPNGMLVDVFALGAPKSTLVAVLRSTDHGLTWSGPITVALDETIGTVDSKTQTPVRTGAGIPSIAADPTTGAIYIVWSDARFSSFQRDGIALSKSIDEGLTWSAPVQVNQAPGVQAFTPAVAAGAGGSVAVTYYDFRKDTPAANSLLATEWRVVSSDGGASWREAPLIRPFDMLSAPQVTGGVPFVGDYQGLTPVSGGFLSFFVAANSGDSANPTSVFAAGAGAGGGDTRANGRIEINLHPRPMRAWPENGPPRAKRHR